jgi:RNA polymerase sigma-70 factor (ECF subfamily)
MGIDDGKALECFNASLALAKSKADKRLLMEKIERITEAC